MKRSWTGSSSAKLGQFVGGSFGSVPDQLNVSRHKFASFEEPIQPPFGHSTGFEKKFPQLSYLVNESHEWEAIYKLIKLAEKIINRKGLYRTDKCKEDLAILVKTYKEWWAVLRSRPSLQDPNVRQLSRQLREFLMIAVEEPTHSISLQSVPLKHKRIVRGKLPMRRKRVSTQALRSGISKSTSFHVDSAIPRLFSVTENISGTGSAAPQKISLAPTASRDSIAPFSTTSNTRLISDPPKRHDPSFIGSQQVHFDSRSEQTYNSAFMEAIVKEVMEKAEKRYLSVHGRKPTSHEFPNLLDRSRRFSHIGQLLIKGKLPDSRPIVRRSSSTISSQRPVDNEEVEEAWEPEDAAIPLGRPLLDFPRINKSLLAEFEEDWRYQRKDHVAVVKFSSLQEKARSIVHTKQTVGYIRPLGKPGFRAKVCSTTGR